MEKKLKQIFDGQFFDSAPINIAIINRNYEVIAANAHFERYFGKWQGRICSEVCKKIDIHCAKCQADDVFENGIPRSAEEQGINADGRPCHYIVHHIPLRDDDGQINNVVNLSMDVTESSIWQREYNLLFDKVPCYIAVINQDYRVIRANEKYRESFGDARGKFCYQAYNNQSIPCKNCPGMKTFADGKDYSSTVIGHESGWDKNYYLMHTAPLKYSNGKPKLIIEIATDISEINKLQEQIRQSHDFYTSIIQEVSDGVVVLDQKGKTKIFNQAARQILEWNYGRKPGSQKILHLLPDSFNGIPDENGVICPEKDAAIITSNDEHVPVRFKAFELKSKKITLGRAAFIQNMKNIKDIEKTALTMERNYAISPAIASFTEIMKQLMGEIEQGAKNARNGIANKNNSEMNEGLAKVKDTYDKANMIISEFAALTIAKRPRLTFLHPNILAGGVIGLYSEDAHSKGIDLRSGLSEDVGPILFDPSGIEICMSNIISNAFDAVLRSDRNNKEITISTYEVNGRVFIEIADNGVGIEKDSLDTIFETMHSSKNESGVGFGLLIANKIVKEHGGDISITSEIDSGTKATISFSRAKLELIAEESRELSE